jgi:ferrous iron transport protein B
MELPAYHMPTAVNVLRSVWERGSSFIRRAGTIILASAVVIWFLSSFGVTDGGFGPVDDLSDGLLADIGSAVAWIFAPLGFGDWQATVAAFTGLIAKENVVSTFGVLYGFAEVAEDGAEIWGSLSAGFTPLTAYAFLVFNLLCAPCFAAIGAIRREMNSAKWTFIAIGYQTGFAYSVALCIFQFGSLLRGGAFGPGTAFAALVAALFLYLLLRPAHRSAVGVPNASIF